PRLTDAFGADHVRIDVVCHTSETLMVALGQPLRMIHEGAVRPQSIDFRILLPSRSINLAFPVLVEEDGDGSDPVHDRWLSMRNAQDPKSTRLNSSHVKSSYAVFCLKK